MMVKIQSSDDLPKYPFDAVETLDYLAKRQDQAAWAMIELRHHHGDELSIFACAKPFSHAVVPCVAGLGAKSKRVERMEKILLVEFVERVTGCVDRNGDQFVQVVPSANLGREKALSGNMIVGSRLAQRVTA
jgi:hypothetical protein